MFVNENNANYLTHTCTSLSLLPFLQKSTKNESEVAKFYNKLAQPDADRRDEVWRLTHMQMLSLVHVHVVCHTKVTCIELSVLDTYILTHVMILRCAEL